MSNTIKGKVWDRHTNVLVTEHESIAANVDFQSHSAASGSLSMAANTGGRSLSTNTGFGGVAVSMGDNSFAEVSCGGAVAVNTGRGGKALARLGGAIVLAYRGDWNHLLQIKCGIVGEHGIKDNTWYQLDQAGNFVECDGPKECEFDRSFVY